MGDCETAIDNTKKFRVKSAADIKAGFNNIRIPEELQTYLGLVTQDGLYIFLRGPFGVNGMPAHFVFAIT